MWLLNAKTRKLQYFAGEDEVEYAILSHTWGDEEVSFDEINSSSAHKKAGYRKIKHTCTYALGQGLAYAWVDTYKRSSAELSEAINSMYRWYSRAKVCYVYLSDVDASDMRRVPQQLRASRWFTRGWTLQELIAPETIEFFDRNGNRFGTKSELLELLSSITRIDRRALESRSWLNHVRGPSVAAKMSWAADRTTTRQEDRAYSLLGLFDVNMPLLYGEGGKKAFQRLQEEIIKSVTFPDHSILVWHTSDSKSATELLAPSPDVFRSSHDVVAWGLPQIQTFELSSKGLQLTCEIFQNQRQGSEIALILNCGYRSQLDSQCLLIVQKDTRIEAFNTDGLYTAAEEEVAYMVVRTGGLRSFETFRTRYGQLVKSTVTLRKQLFQFPRHQDKVQVSFPSSLARAKPGSITTDDILHNERSGSGVFSLDLSSLSQGDKKVTVLRTIKVETWITSSAQWIETDVTFFVDIKDAEGKAPGLKILVGQHDIWTASLQNGENADRANFQNGETIQFAKNGINAERDLYTTLAITARYVSLAGDVFWSITIEPGKSEMKELLDAIWSDDAENVVQKSTLSNHEHFANVLNDSDVA